MCSVTMGRILYGSVCRYAVHMYGAVWISVLLCCASTYLEEQVNNDVGTYVCIYGEAIHVGEAI